MENSKITVEEFEDILLEMESEAEYEIDNFDACNNNHWNEMTDRSLEMTFAHFIELGYTENEVMQAYDEYND